MSAGFIDGSDWHLHEKRMELVRHQLEFVRKSHNRPRTHLLPILVPKAGELNRAFRYIGFTSWRERFREKHVISRVLGRLAIGASVRTDQGQ